jgi:hypothetical protein
MIDNVKKVTTNLQEMADNSQDLTENIPDNAFTKGNCTPDNTPENESMAADNTQHNTAKRELSDKTSILELQKKYGIGRDPLYSRMRYLAITTWKVSGKAYLDARQVAQMDGLHDHIKATGRMEGYPIPEPSGPRKEETQEVDSPELQEELQQTEAITVSSSQIENLFTATCQAVVATASQADIEQIKAEAQQRVKAKRLAIIQVARAYEENPDLLPDEIKAEIQAEEMAAISTPLNHKPYYDPNALAQLVIQTL